MKKKKKFIITSVPSRFGISHQAWNTILATISLVIGAVLAANELLPPSDTLDVFSEGLLASTERTTLQENSFFNTYSDDSMDVIGPVVWKIRVSNRSSHPVSIIGFRTFLIGKDNQPYYYSAINDELLIYPNLSQPLTLPINIQPYESRAVAVSLFMPIEKMSSQEKQCLEKQHLKLIERCLFKFGRDLSGNDVEIKGRTGTAGNISVGWDPDLDDLFGYDFILSVRTADESSFATRLSYEFQPYVR